MGDGERKDLKRTEIKSIQRIQGHHLLDETIPLIHCFSLLDHSLRAAMRSPPYVFASTRSIFSVPRTCSQAEVLRMLEDRMTYLEKLLKEQPKHGFPTPEKIPAFNAVIDRIRAEFHIIHAHGQDPDPVQPTSTTAPLP